jgi:hypothetical protein
MQENSPWFLSPGPIPPCSRTELFSSYDQNIIHWKFVYKLPITLTKSQEQQATGSGGSRRKTSALAHYMIDHEMEYSQTKVDHIFGEVSAPLSVLTHNVNQSYFLPTLLSAKLSSYNIIIIYDILLTLFWPINIIFLTITSVPTDTVDW